jgi:hypothetical protein
MEEIMRSVAEERHTFRIVKSKTSDSIAIPIPMKVRRSFIRAKDIFNVVGDVEPGIYDIRFYKVDDKCIHIKLTRIKVDDKYGNR